LLLLLQPSFSRGLVAAKTAGCNLAIHMTLCKECIDRIGVPLGVYERVVDTRDGYLVVEKVGDAGAVVERAARRP
jgi:hypothetical protein